MEKAILKFHLVTIVMTKAQFKRRTFCVPNLMSMSKVLYSISESSSGYYEAADRYPEGASSNPARVNIFQLTSAV